MGSTRDMTKTTNQQHATLLKENSRTTGIIENIQTRPTKDRAPNQSDSEEVLKDKNARHDNTTFTKQAAILERIWKTLFGTIYYGTIFIFGLL